jgi:hypothetical protein
VRFTLSSFFFPLYLSLSSGTGGRKEERGKIKKVPRYFEWLFFMAKKQNQVTEPTELRHRVHRGLILNFLRVLCVRAP